MKTYPVFVYGTLRKGGSNHFRMSGARFVGSGAVAGRMYKIDWYPALVLEQGRRVIGELYEVEEAQLAELDRFEGISADCDEPREYQRVKTQVSLDDGSAQEAWIWEWIGSIDRAQALDCEDWLEYEPNPS